MSHPLRDLYRLFFPHVCPACGEPLPDKGAFLCTRCRWNMPLTGFWKEVDNPGARKFHDVLPIVQASSLFYFVHDSEFRELIHGFKYNGKWRVALELGRIYGSELKECGLYDTVEVIVPVPLHIRRTLHRGYNQSAYIAQGIAESLKIPVDTQSVVRTRNNSSQTRHSREDRWDNVRDIFSVRHPERLAGKHILLVDDVLKSSSTLQSLGGTILRAVPDCRLSIATLAVPRGELEK